MTSPSLKTKLVLYPRSSSFSLVGVASGSASFPGSLTMSMTAGVVSTWGFVENVQ